MDFEENLSELGVEIGEVISIQDEETEEEKDFRVMYIFDIEDRIYLCLVPVDQEDEEEFEVHFLRYDGTDTLTPIESEEEWENVSATFDALLAEQEED
jgi:uncharacterized protein YrzB (UPF0473 family)